MKSLKLGDHLFEWGSRTYLMGILNITEDSFSGDGLLIGSNKKSAILEQARQFVESGVDVLDVGGESTRPGAEPIDESTEMKRVIPAIWVQCTRHCRP